MDKYVTLFIGLENFNYFLRVACATLKDQVNIFVYKNHREVNMVYTIQVKFGSMIPYCILCDFDAANVYSYA